MRAQEPNLGLLPRQPDARYLEHLARRRPFATVGPSRIPVITRPDDAIVLLRSGRLNKAAVHKRVEVCASSVPALQTVARTSFVFLDPPSHGDLRSAVAQISRRSDTGLRAAVEQRVRQQIHSLPTGEAIDLTESVGGPVARIVVEEVLGLSPSDSDVSDALLAAAPVLNDLIASPRCVGAAANACEDALAGVEARLAAGSAGRPGRLLSVLSEQRHLDLDSRAGLATFVAVVGAEAMRSHASACALAAPSGSDALDVLRWASPVQFAIYATADDIKIGERCLEGSQIVLLNLHGRTAGESIPFGFGRHLCLGAQIAMWAGNAVISAISRRTPSNAGRECTWDVKPITRRIEGDFVLDGD